MDKDLYNFVCYPLLMQFNFNKYNVYDQEVDNLLNHTTDFNCLSLVNLRNKEVDFEKLYDLAIEKIKNDKSCKAILFLSDDISKFTTIKKSLPEIKICIQKIVYEIGKTLYLFCISNERLVYDIGVA